ncbi:expressed unknown protein [Seminavis robusta]|uniref:Uncharacterized protein n=1 Tax=Seminavis robusta TaxID=568900 RepID=A0A9N8H395_9STRA|nr:expressed unknown protein [Seminavis robusta]|eukprot:Sro33_g021702.1  (131) ;mRNA; r:147074-147466
MTYRYQADGMNTVRDGYHSPPFSSRFIYLLAGIGASFHFISFHSIPCMQPMLSRCRGQHYHHNVQMKPAKTTLQIKPRHCNDNVRSVHHKNTTICGLLRTSIRPSLPTVLCHGECISGGAFSKKWSRAYS